MKEMGERFFLSGSMINEVEHGRKKLPKDVKPQVARQMDDGWLYLEIAQEATGSVMVSPFLDNVDDHRVVGLLKFGEEVREAIEALNGIMPIVLRARNQAELRPGEKQKVEAAMLEVIEATTAAQNALARVAKCYQISLAELYDRHQEELVQKGYMTKKKDR